MAWDTEGTRRRLKEAATEEFAARGRDGTTMARIAARAGLNKERLYNYFVDKQTLWETVLADEMDRVAAAVPVGARGLQDVGEFAGANFDYHVAHPQLSRLLQWEGLQGGMPADLERRSAHYREKVARFEEAQRAGRIRDGLEPRHLVFALIALSAWWQTAPQLAAMISGVTRVDDHELAARRRFVVAAARRMADPAEA